MKRLQTVLHYYTKETLPGFFGFLGIYSAILLAFATVISVRIGGANEGSVSSYEVLFAIALISICLSIYRESLHFFIQHGISRRTTYLGFFLFLLFTSLAFSIAATLLNVLLAWVVAVTSGNTNILMLPAQIYPEFLATVSPLARTLVSLSFNWVFLFALGALGWLIAALFNQLSKMGKVLVGSAVAGFYLILLPLINRMVDGRLGTWAFYALRGRGEMPMPGNAILVLLAHAVLWLALSWLLMRRFKVQK